jgi:hypothetical protein
MNNYIDVINKTLDLSDSVGEAIGFIKDNLHFKNYFVIDRLISDSIKSIISIDQAIKPILKLLGDKQLEGLTAALYSQINLLYKAIDSDISNNAAKIICIKVIPTYSEWKYEIEGSFRKFTYS